MKNRGLKVLHELGLEPSTCPSRVFEPLEPHHLFHIVTLHGRGGVGGTLPPLQRPIQDGDQASAVDGFRPAPPILSLYEKTKSI